MKPIITYTIILILTAGQCLAQISDLALQTAYENALLDSTFKFELLKPAFFNLKSAYEYQGKEAEFYKTALHISELQIELQAKEYKTQLDTDRRKRFRLSAAAGLIGLLLGLTAGL